LHAQPVAAVCADRAWLELAGQVSHAAEPFAVLYCPARHAAQGPPSTPVYPAWQRHALASVWAVSAWPECSPQALHAAEPFAVLYCPSGHAAQDPPSTPVYPASQRHALASVCAVSAWPECSPQALHAAEPVASLKRDPAHAAHGPPSGPVWPALHQQRSMRLLPAPDVEFPGHATHALAADAPEAPPYVPALQLAQSAAPPAACVPALQLLHTEADAAEYVPALQLAQSAAPAAANVPAPHAAQLESPALAAYVPALQALHAPAPGAPP